MQRHNTENEPQRQHQHHDRIDLQPRRLIRIQPYRPPTTSAHLSLQAHRLPLSHHPLSTPLFTHSLPPSPPLPFQNPSHQAPSLTSPTKKNITLTQHSTTTPPRPRRPRAARPCIRHLIGAIGSRFAPDRRLRTPRRRRRGRARGAGAGARGGAAEGGRGRVGAW